MKKTYLCSSCHQYHSLKHSQKKQKSHPTAPYIRFSDLFGYQPKPNPRVFTISRDIQSERTASVHQNGKSKSKSKPIIPIKLPKRNRLKTQFPNQKKSQIYEKISSQSRLLKESKNKSVTFETPFVEGKNEKTFIEDKQEPIQNMRTKQTHKKQLTPMALNSYPNELQNSQEFFEENEKLMLKRQVTFGPSNFEFDSKKQKTQLKQLMGAKINKQKRKLMTIGCKKQFCSLRDNRCLGFQMCDEGEVQLQLTPIL